MIALILLGLATFAAGGGAVGLGRRLGDGEEAEQRAEAAESAAMIARFCSLSDVVRAMPPGSPELERYTAAVYGRLSNAGHRRRRLKWFAAYLKDEVEVLWERQLPRALRACAWPKTARRPEDVYRMHSHASQVPGTLWIYRLPAATLPCIKGTTNTQLNSSLFFAGTHLASSLFYAGSPGPAYLEVAHRGGDTTASRWVITNYEPQKRQLTPPEITNS
jgi:hypothetical protein